MTCAHLNLQPYFYVSLKWLYSFQSPMNTNHMVMLGRYTSVRSQLCESRSHIRLSVYKAVCIYVGLFVFMTVYMMCFCVFATNCISFSLSVWLFALLRVCVLMLLVWVRLFPRHLNTCSFPCWQLVWRSNLLYPSFFLLSLVKNSASASMWVDKVWSTWIQEQIFRTKLEWTKIIIDQINLKTIPMKNKENYIHIPPLT